MEIGGNFKFSSWIILALLAGGIPADSIESDPPSKGKPEPRGRASHTNRSAPPPPPPFSNMYLLRLADSDGQVYESLRQFLPSLTDDRNEELRIHILRFLQDYERSSGLLTSPTPDDRRSQVVQNPVLVFRMIFRFAVDLEAIKSDLVKYENENAEALLKTLQTLVAEEARPDMEVLEEAAERLLVLMHTYDLQVSAVASGLFQSISTGFSLEGRHCVAIGEFASQTGYHALAVDWVTHAQELGTGASAQAQEEMAQLLQRVVSKHDAEYDSGSEEEFPQYKFFMSKINGGSPERIRQRTHHGKRDHRMPGLLKYYDICSGGNFQSEDTKSELSCWYDHNLHPEFRLSPLKVELLSMSPLLFQFYDIITKGDAQQLIEAAEPRQAISQVFDPELGRGRRSVGRTSFSTYLYNIEFPPCRRLTRRIHRITRLSPYGIPYQLASYTYGSTYGLHHDAVVKEEADKLGIVQNNTGNRLATFMIYLSNVGGGGITAFPDIGIGIQPVARSGVFWLNLDEDEERDEDLVHAGCPVILGEPKWIANMVIRNPLRIRIIRVGKNDKLSVGFQWMGVRDQFLSWKCMPRN